MTLSLKKIDKIMSNLYGVTKGSILGPILFNILSITLLKLIQHRAGITTSKTLYVDNVQLLFSGTPNNLEQLKYMHIQA